LLLPPPPHRLLRCHRLLPPLPPLRTMIHRLLQLLPLPPPLPRHLSLLRRLKLPLPLPLPLKRHLRLRMLLLPRWLPPPRRRRLLLLLLLPLPLLHHPGLLRPKPLPPLPPPLHRHHRTLPMRPHWLLLPRYRRRLLPMPQPMLLRTGS
jgi:hypothetical protein